MKRWNGWGDTTITQSLSKKVTDYLADFVGVSTPNQDATLAQAIASVPPSRLPSHPLVTHDSELRLRHACGQSWPDWIRLRHNQIPAFPDGIAFPETDEAVETLLQWAAQHQFKVIPYGGGTSVVGHINPGASEQPVLTINMQRLNRLRWFDTTSHLATFGAGVAGPDLEAQLRAKGFTLGHFPQSFDYSTLGGWIVTRSSGQQSLGYGRIEELFAGGKLYAPAGELTLPPFPASGAGPDLRQIVLGSEGRLGILTEATMRVAPLPEKERFYGFFFPNFAAGQAAVREMMQSHLPLSMLRLSNATETETTLKLAGHERAIGALETLLKVRHVSQDKVILLMGLTGPATLVDASRKLAFALAKTHDGVFVGKQFGKAWQANRFQAPYLRNTLWEMGYGVDTVETAVTWDQVDALIDCLETKLKASLTPFNERIHVYTHLSHMYTSGCSIYTTYLFRLSHNADEDMARWQQMKTAASEAIVQQGGTISHQHGVGKDHKPFLMVEKGALGIAAIQGLTQTFDPMNILNTGNLVG